MSIVYTWKLVELKKTDTSSLNNVVIGTRWECTGTDEEGNTGTFNGATPFDLSTVDPNNFITWENLTESIVLGWIQSVVVGGYEEHVNAQIAKQINAKKNPVVDVSGNNFPWITN